MASVSEPIYIVDDDRSICDTLEGILSDEGYTVEKCRDAETLFNKLQNIPPALILLDIWLPGSDGLDVLHKLCKLYPETSVIMISGHAGIDSVVRAIKIGAYDFLEKPFNVDNLINKVKGALNKKQSKSSIAPNANYLGKAKPQNNIVRGAMTKDNPGQPQRTIKKSIVLNGNGLLSGKKTGIILSPLEDNQGIIFKTLSGQTIPAHVTYLENFTHARKPGNFTANSTILVANNNYIRTVEHLMASFSMLGISNILITVENEIPNIDGSALDFCKLILDAGIVEQTHPVKIIVIGNKLTIGQENTNEKYLYVEPFDGFEITMRINYPAPIFEQTFTFNPQKQDFFQEIAPARSFNTFENIGIAQKMGKVGGGYLDSHIIIHNGAVINTELRYADEFVRHKILDLIGDLYLLGSPIQGRVVANMTSHNFNHALSKKIYTEQSN
jgi:UDP-3-O-[3-hydroxymyristoyl] N-acetylglucosamine deacetylase